PHVLPPCATRCPYDRLRSLPSVGELLDSAPLRPLVARLSRNVVVHGVRSFLDELREEVERATAPHEPRHCGSAAPPADARVRYRSEEQTSELQSPDHI